MNYVDRLTRLIARAQKRGEPMFVVLNLQARLRLELSR